jgi:hypothetical protein
MTWILDSASGGGVAGECGGGAVDGGVSQSATTLGGDVGWHFRMGGAYEN